MSWWETDAKGIPLARVCPICKDRVLKKYRPEVLTDPGYRPGGVMTVLVKRADGTVAEEWKAFRCDGEAYRTYGQRVAEYRRQTGTFDSSHTVELVDKRGVVVQRETI
jgi:hypothetical protein